MNITRSSLKLSLANAGVALIVFGGITVFARILTPSQLGVFFLFEALLGILAIPADFGLRGAIKKRISESDRPTGVLGTALLLKIVPLTIIIGGIIAFRTQLDTYVGTTIAPWLIVGLLSYEAYHLGIQILSGELRVGDTAALRILQKVVWLGLGATLVHLGFGVYGLIYSAIVGYGLAFLWGIYKCRTSLGSPSVVTARSLVNYSKYNFISSVSGYFYNWMDILIIGLFLTTNEVGAYETAWRVTAVVLLASKAIGESIFPQVSQWNSQEAAARIEQLIPRVITPSLLFVIPSVLGSLLFSREILRYLFGPEYTIAWLVLIVLMFEKVLQSVHVIVGRSLKAIDHPELAARAAVITIVTNLVLNVVLIWQFGLVGAAVATSISFLVNTVLCTIYLNRFVTFRVPWLEIGWLAGASVLMTLGLLVLRSFVAVDSLVSLLGMIFAGAVMYGAVALVYTPFRSELIDRMYPLLRRDPTDTIKDGN